MKFKLLFLLLSLLFFSCSKKGTLERDYWTSRISGAYEVVSIEYKKYVNNDLIYDTINSPSKAVLLLYSNDGDGFGHPMKLFGSWVPNLVSTINSTGFGWNVENDNKRLTLGHFDPSIGYVPDGTLTIDNLKSNIQYWHFVSSVVNNGTDQYLHEIIKVKRVNH